MLGRLILIFIIVPLADLCLLLALSKYIGFWTSVWLVILSGVIGAFLARRASMSVGRKLGAKMAQGQLAPDLLTDGAMIFFAAGLLLTPGFITDLIGLSILVPGIRRFYKRIVSGWIKRNVNIQMTTHGSMFEGMQGSPFEDPNTVDGQVNSRTTDESQFDSPEKLGPPETHDQR